MIEAQRVREIFAIFPKILPLPTDASMNIGGIPIPLGDILPMIMTDLARIANKYPEQAEGIFDWVIESLLYIKGDTDDLPRMLMPHETPSETFRQT
jgi:hypothetical protein